MLPALIAGDGWGFDYSHGYECCRFARGGQAISERRQAPHLAIAMVLDGFSREEAARLCGMDRQTLRTGFTAIMRPVWMGFLTGREAAGQRA